MPGAFSHGLVHEGGPFEKFGTGQTAPHSIGIIVVVHQIGSFTLDAQQPTLFDYRAAGAYLLGFSHAVLPLPATLMAGREKQVIQSEAYAPCDPLRHSPRLKPFRA